MDLLNALAQLARTTEQLRSIVKDLANFVTSAYATGDRRKKLKETKISGVNYVLSRYEEAVKNGRPYTYNDMLANINTMLYLRQGLVLELEMILDQPHIDPRDVYFHSISLGELLTYLQRMLTFLHPIMSELAAEQLSKLPHDLPQFIAASEMAIDVIATCLGYEKWSGWEYTIEDEHVLYVSLTDQTKRAHLRELCGIMNLTIHYLNHAIIVARKP